MTVVRTRTVAAVAAALVSSWLTGPAATAADAGSYRGTVIEDDGQVSPKEWVRFRVSQRQRVVDFRSRVWLQCYVYPNSYYQLPVVFEMPKARIDGRRVDRSWTQQIPVDDEVETLEGRVQLRFKANGAVRGRLSIDVANCASRLGDPPYWVSFRAKHG